MLLLFVFLLNLLVDTNAQVCTSFVNYTAPITIEMDPYPFVQNFTCYKITGASNYYFSNFTIGLNYPYAYFYFYNAEYDARQGNGYQYTTYGSYYTTSPAYPATATGELYFSFYTDGSTTATWVLEVNAIPAGAPCTASPVTNYNGGYGYTMLDRGTCAPAGGTPSGASCQLTCDDPKTIYSDPINYPRYYARAMYCWNGVWLTNKYPTFCYYADTCSGSTLQDIVDTDAVDFSSCSNKDNYLNGDTCTMTCKTSYVAVPSYLPVFSMCYKPTYQWGYPPTLHTSWQEASSSANCEAPCLNLPSVLVNGNPGFSRGTCKAGADVTSGSTCTMQCTQDYTQTGSLLMTCDDSTWSSSGGSCEAPCTTQPAISNFVAKCSLTAHSRSTCNPPLECPTNYVASGDLTTTCVNGGWSYPSGECKAPCTTAPIDPINGTFASGCSGTKTSGFQCAVNCNSGSVPSSTSAVCDNGVWITPTCDRYEWQNQSWGSCDSPAATCVAGLASSNGGLQTRDVNCVNVLTRQPTTDRFCSQSGAKLATSQPCNIACPQTPTINGVVAYDGAIKLTITVHDPQIVYDDDIDPFIYISPCVATKTGGQCELNDKSPLLPSTWTRIPFSDQFGYFNATTGRQFSVVYYNLTNGVSYSFRAVYQYVDDRVYESDYSAGSSGTAPVAGNCYGGCVNGKCVRGVCACNPGVLYPPNSNCTTAAMLDVPTFPFMPYNISRSSSGSTQAIEIYWSTNLPYIHIYLLPESCRANKECVPATALRFVTGSSGYSMFYSTTEGPGAYFVRLFWTSQLVNDSASFQILDPACTGINCQNGGKCNFGKCACTTEWKNNTCTVKRDACDLAGLDCGIWGTCDGDHCKCDDGWNGERCQYPPKCDLRCQHGLPNDALRVLAPGNSWGCTYCNCDGYWWGDHCDQCGMKCYNGGYTDDKCTSCTCQTWYTGSSCQDKYWIASFQVKLSPSNLNLDLDSDRAVFNKMIEQDITQSLSTSIPFTLKVQSVGNTATVWIIAGDKSTIVRSNLLRQITGQYYGQNNGLLFQSTLTGEKVQAATYMEKDPPNVGGLTTPNVFITLCVLLLGFMMKY